MDRKLKCYNKKSKSFLFNLIIYFSLIILELKYKYITILI